MAVGTEAGDVLICDSSDLRATIHSACSGEAITAVAPFGKASLLFSTCPSRFPILEFCFAVKTHYGTFLSNLQLCILQGLVIGTADSSFSLFERIDDGSYKSYCCHSLDPGNVIRSMLLISEDSFAFLTATGQLLKATTAIGKNKVCMQNIRTLQPSKFIFTIPPCH